MCTQKLCLRKPAAVAHSIKRRFEVCLSCKLFFSSLISPTLLYSCSILIGRACVEYWWLTWLEPLLPHSKTRMSTPFNRMWLLSQPRDTTVPTIIIARPTPLPTPLPVSSDESTKRENLEVPSNGRERR